MYFINAIGAFSTDTVCGLIYMYARGFITITRVSHPLHCPVYFTKYIRKILLVFNIRTMHKGWLCCSILVHILNTDQMTQPNSKQHKFFTLLKNIRGVGDLIFLSEAVFLWIFKKIYLHFKSLRFLWICSYSSWIIRGFLVPNDAKNEDVNKKDANCKTCVFYILFNLFYSLFKYCSKPGR